MGRTCRVVIRVADSVMEGRRFRFMATGPRGAPTGYQVEAFPVSRVLGGGPLLGYVRPDTRSTDSRIAGTRLRRQGKGARVWRAEVPRSQWDHRRGRDGERILSTPKTAGQLQHCYGGGYRLEEFGQTWDTRQEAAQALAEWYDQGGAAVDA